MGVFNFQIQKYFYKNRIVGLLFLTFIIILTKGFSQFTYPIDIEGTYGVGQVFQGFGGTTTAIVDNPDLSNTNCYNRSAKVLQINKGNQTWSGMEFALATPIPAGTFGVGGSKPNFCFNYFTNAPAGYQILFKFDGDPDMYQVATVSGAWGQVCYTPPASSNGKNKPVIIFRNGTAGNVTDPNFRLYVDNLNFYANGSIPAAPIGFTAGSQYFVPPSTVTFTYTPGDVGPYNWYSTQSGGASLFTGNPFTTPVLNVETSYWLQTGSTTTVDRTVGPSCTLADIGNSKFGTERFTCNLLNAGLKGLSIRMYRIGGLASDACGYTAVATNVTTGVSRSFTTGTTSVYDTEMNFVFATPLPMTVGDEITVRIAANGPISCYVRMGATGCSASNPHLPYPSTVHPDVTFTSCASEAVAGTLVNRSNMFVGYNYRVEGELPAARIQMNAVFNCPVILPITLSSFEAICSKENILVSWKTASEERNDYFLLEKSLDGLFYETVDKIYSKGTGTSSTEQNYLYIDKSNTNKYYYRLVQFDFDGKSEIFTPIYVDCNDNNSLFEVFPNPTDGANFEIVLQEKSMKGLCDLKITDSKGSLIFCDKINVNLGLNKFQINENIESGVYFVEIINGNDSVKRKKIVVY